MRLLSIGLPGIFATSSAVLPMPNLLCQQSRQTQFGNRIQSKGTKFPEFGKKGNRFAFSLLEAIAGCGGHHS